MESRDPRGLASHIMLALDTDTEEEGYRVLEACSEHIGAIKIGYPLVLRTGLGVIRRIVDRFGLPVLADFKVADVPVTNERITTLARDAGAWAIMVHGIIGPDGLESVLRIAGDDMRIIVQTELTHPGGLIFTQGIADAIAEVAREVGCHGVQAPGNRPNRIRAIRNIVGDRMLIVCCGVGVQGGDLRGILEAGGDYAIIGRSIYASADPSASVRSIIASATR